MLAGVPHALQKRRRNSTDIAASIEAEEVVALQQNLVRSTRRSIGAALAGDKALRSACMHVLFLCYAAAAPLCLSEP